MVLRLKRKITNRRTKLPVGVCRGIVEFLALTAGWLLGGMVGVGTIISVLAIGFCVQITFKLFRIEPADVRHETLGQTCSVLFGKSGQAPDNTETDS